MKKEKKGLLRKAFFFFSWLIDHDVEKELEKILQIAY